MNLLDLRIFLFDRKHLTDEPVIPNDARIVVELPSTGERFIVTNVGYYHEANELILDAEILEKPPWKKPPGW